jgi:hypothetical protein
VSIVNLSSYRRTRSIAARGPALAEIMDALLHNGGALHRSEVARQVAAWRGVRAREDIIAIELELAEAFRDYLATTDTRTRPPLLFQPFGPHSYRWALTEAGRALLLDRHAPRRRTR